MWDLPLLVAEPLVFCFFAVLLSLSRVSRPLCLLGSTFLLSVRRGSGCTTLLRYSGPSHHVGIDWSPLTVQQLNWTSL